MKLGELWRQWRRSGLPEKMLTEAEAADRVREYALANGRDFQAPMSTHIEGRVVDANDRSAGRRYVYVMALGTSRPMPIVEVDAVSGAVLAWRSLPR